MPITVPTHVPDGLEACALPGLCDASDHGNGYCTAATTNEPVGGIAFLDVNVCQPHLVEADRRSLTDDSRARIVLFIDEVDKHGDRVAAIEAIITDPAEAHALADAFEHAIARIRAAADALAQIQAGQS